MATQLHDTGEEAIMDSFFDESVSKPTSVSVSLYNDATDTLTDSSDVSDITTEPAGTSFARQTASFGADFTNSTVNGDRQSVIADQTFDTSDSSQSVDAYFVVITFTSDVAGDSGDKDHLLFTGSLDQTYDLNDIDQFTLSGSGISLD